MNCFSEFSDHFPDDAQEQGAVESATAQSADAATRFFGALAASFPAESLAAAMATISGNQELANEIDKARNELCLAVMASAPADTYARLYRFQAIEIQGLLARIASLIAPNPDYLAQRERDLKTGAVEVQP